VGLLVLAAVRDKPTDLGFPPTDPAAQKKAAAADKQNTEAAAASTSNAGGNMMAALKSVMQQPAVWALAFTYFFIYVVRQGVTSWLVFYLMAEKGAADAGSAALTVSGLELGGLAGSTVAGLLSDRAIRGAKQGAGLVGKRIQVGALLWHCMGCSAAAPGRHARTRLPSRPTPRARPCEQRSATGADSMPEMPAGSNCAFVLGTVAVVQLCLAVVRTA
jgi:sugar phosphate permease